MFPKNSGRLFGRNPTRESVGHGGVGGQQERTPDWRVLGAITLTSDLSAKRWAGGKKTQCLTAATAGGMQRGAARTPCQGAWYYHAHLAVIGIYNLLLVLPIQIMCGA